MNNQKGVIYFLPLILLVVAAGTAVAFYLGIIKNPFQNLPLLSKIGQREPTVEVKSEYKNPFKKETQYVNPFETYKNPFSIAR